MKTIRTMLWTLGQWTLPVLLLAPAMLFAWRSLQPLGQPAYQGRSLVQVLLARQQAYARLAEAHPAGKAGLCFGSELAVLAYSLPWAGVCALADVLPALASRLGAKARALGCGSPGGHWETLPVTAWDRFERMLFDLHQHIQGSAVAYCRIAPGS